jgi:hypothetical protein
MKSWKIFLGMIVLTSLIPAHAETNVYAQASTAQTNVFLGQVFTLDVIVKSADEPQAPDLTHLADFNVTVLEAGMATSAIHTFLYRYAFRATREGELTIPALSYQALNQRILTQPLTIRAQKPKFSARMTLKSKVSKKSVYLGEPIVLTTTWDSTYPFGALKAVDFHFPILNDKRFQILEPYEPEKEKKVQTTGLPVHGTRVLATRKNYIVEGLQHQSLSFSKILIPKHVGKLSLQPSTLLCAAEQEKNPKTKQGQRSAFQYPAYFDNTFFDQNLTGKDYIRIYTESAPIELDIKPLPTQGRPSLFNGMVGDYSIQTSAEPTTVRVGEPITLTVTITADTFMENIFFQPLRYQPLLINRFEIPEERALPLRGENSKTYTQTIRPLATTLSNIPPVQLVYFSPVSNAYITAQSTPIPLHVSPAESVSAFGLDSMPYRTRLQSVKAGIRHNYENPGMLKNRSRPLLGNAPPALVFSTLLLPPLMIGILMLFAIFGERKHHIHRTAKAARAYKIYRKNAAHIIRSHTMKREVYGDLDEVLRVYFGDRLHLNPGALTFRDVAIILTEAGAETAAISDLRELFVLCEAYRFTDGFDGTADTKSIIHHANRVVKAVERSLK